MNDNPIVVQDCADEIWPDTWSLILDGETIAYAKGEEWAGMLAAIFNPNDDPLELLDVLILVMRAGNQLMVDFERLRQETEGRNE